MYNTIQVYYQELNPNSIINLDQPCHYNEFHNLPGYLETGSKETFDVVNSLYFEKIDQCSEHWSRLLDHISRWGIIYPVIVNTGLPKFRPLRSVPKEYRNTDSKFWMICEQQGGARILAAQQLGIKVPAIINDYVGLFKNQKPLVISDLHNLCNGVEEVQLMASAGVKIPRYPRIHIDVDDIIYEECRKYVIDDIVNNYLK